MKLKPIFVYGTLRKGEGNYQWASRCVDSVDEDATTPGHLWFFGSRRSYPVAQFLPSSPDRIIGDVLWCNTKMREYQSMCSMEIGAGYEMRAIDVTLKGGEEIEAFGFHYLDTPDPALFIPSGDWRAEHDLTHPRNRERR